MKATTFGAQMPLVVEHVAAQAGIEAEGDVERLAQGGRRRLDLGRRGEAAKLLGEDKPGHSRMMPAARRCKMPFPPQQGYSLETT